MPATTERTIERPARSKVAVGPYAAAKKPQGLATTTAAVSTALKIRAQIEKLEEQLESMNLAVVPKVKLSRLHDKDSGRIDAQKLADFIGIPLKRLAEGLGLNYKAVHQRPSASGFQAALRPIKRVLELLQQFVGSPAAIRAWLNTSHPDLDGTTALDTILEGKSEAVLLILENAWNGIPV